MTELLSDVRSNSILESYVWRSAETFLNDSGEIKSEILSFIRETSRQYPRETFDTLLKIVGNTDHPLRGEWLHRFLANLSLTQRDLTWSTSMRHWDNDSVQARIISWARTSDAIHSLDEAEREEYATVLSWIFTSSDRKYRDTATKALVRLLDDDFEATAGLIRRFDDINDPYITHRLYCAAYGQVLRHPNKEGIADIAEILFEKEFQNNRPVPDFLAREYARNIIEIAVDRHSFSADSDLLKPPHETEWNGAPSVEDVRKKRNDLISRARNEDEKRAVNSLWGDLVGKDSDSTGYSDFSRYIIGTNHGVEFSNFDYPYEEGCRWILDRVLDFGWNPTLFAEDESRSSYRQSGHLETRKIESFRKKYQWIAYWELLGHLSDNHQKTASEDDENNIYINSWEEFLRDIDPSALTANQSKPDSVWWRPKLDPFDADTESEKWVSNASEMIRPKDIVTRDSDPEKLVLHGYFSWTDDSSPPRKSPFYHIHSVVVDEEYEELLKSYILGNWVYEHEGPDKIVRTPEVHQSFVGEIPWHESCSRAREHQPIDDFDYPHQTAGWSFTGIEEYDSSTTDTYSGFVPSAAIMEVLDLDWDVKNWKAVSSNSLSLYDPSLLTPDPTYPPSSKQVDQSGPTSLVAPKDQLFERLQSSSKSLLWVFLSERQLIESGKNSGYSLLRGIGWISECELSFRTSSTYYNPDEATDRHPGLHNWVPESLLSQGWDVFEGVNGVSEAKMDQLKESGFTSVFDVVLSSEEDLIEVDGIGRTLAKRLQEHSLKIIDAEKPEQPEPATPPEWLAEGEYPEDIREILDPDKDG